jgi:cytidyltransferase-like protein
MVIYCGGTFDLVHPGHVWFFREVKRVYLRYMTEQVTLAVSLNTDEFVTRYKGKPPAMSFWERKVMLESLECVDFVVKNVGDEDSKPAIEVVSPDVIANGSDWTRERLLKQMMLTEEFLSERNITIDLFNNSHPLHTSNILERIVAR